MEFFRQTRIRQPCVIRSMLVVAFFVVGFASSPLLGQDESLQLIDLVGQVVDVRIEGNEQYSGCTITKAAAGKLSGSIKNLKIQPAGTKKTRNIPVNKVVEIFVDGQPLDVKFDKKTRSLVRNPEKRAERLDWERQVNSQLSRDRRRLWPYLTQARRDEYMEVHRTFVEDTRKALPGIQFRFVETEYFMFLTDLSSAEVDGLIVYLDAMYAELCKAFGIPPTQNIWCGKCVVVAFREEADFLNFERVVMKNPNAKGAQGLCHGLSDGRVIFAGFQGSNGFPNVIVHETTHGFVFRYLSNARVPSWLNEGMSDWIGHEIVKSNRIPRRRKSAAERVRRAGTLGDFFQAQPIQGDDYGVASAMVEILIQRDKGTGKFKEFFDGIKLGKDPEQALKESFGLTYQELTVIYARAIGMNQIR